MLEFYLYIYGIAVFLCLLAYIYARIDWYLRHRQLNSPRSQERYQQRQELGETTLKIEDTPVEVKELTVENLQPMLPMQSTQPADDLDADMDSTPGSEDESDCMSIENSECTNVVQSWDTRREARRQRFINSAEKEKDPKDSVDGGHSSKPTPIFVNQICTHDNPDDLLHEIMAAHDLCSRRESVQVTDLDEKYSYAATRVSEPIIVHDAAALPRPERLSLQQPCSLESQAVFSGQLRRSSNMELSFVGNQSVLTMQSQLDSPTGKTSSPIDKVRRFSLRSKHSLDNSCEKVDENFLSSDRKLAAMQGFHFAAFRVSNAKRTERAQLVNLVEDQCVDCLDADNPDCWVVRVHPELTRSLSSRNKLTHQSSLVITESTSPEEPTGKGGFTDTSPVVSKSHIGRVYSVCLTRQQKGVQRGKRDPRELFREEVITISNKQQEAKMKRRYALTELVETEREYIKAIKPISDVLARLSNRITLRLGQEDEETVDLPIKLRPVINGLCECLKEILVFSENTLLDEFIACSMNPQQAAECFTKHVNQLELYSAYLYHLDTLVSAVTKLNGTESEAMFYLNAPPIGKTIPTTDGSETSAPFWSQRTNIPFRYLTELADTPRIRMTSYRTILRDVARYTARADSETVLFEEAMTHVSQAVRRAEESCNFWSQLSNDGVDGSELMGLEWKSKFFNQRTGHAMPPALTRLLQDLRLGVVNSESTETPWFDVWDVSGSEAGKTIIRIYCPNQLSRDAWMEDMACVLTKLLNADCFVSGLVVSAHEEADLQRRLHHAPVMDLADFRSESLAEGEEDEEWFLDALEGADQGQQAAFQAVQALHLTNPGDVDLTTISIMTHKKRKSDDSASSSYHTADEAPDDAINSQTNDTSTTLYESYITSDGVTTPFSEDQRSMLEEQIAEECEEIPSAPPPGSVVKQLTVNTGEQIQFNASFTISGPVAYEVQWFMNGHPIPSQTQADMILSDTDTRLLIAYADPAIHAGTYVCRCRLFDGTETAVYFHVNVLSPTLETLSIGEGQLQEAGISEQEEVTPKISEMTPGWETSTPELLHPLVKNIDLPIGQLLELRVELDEEAALTLLKNQNIKNPTLVWERLKVQWLHDDELLQSTMNCKISIENTEDHSIAVLQTVTSNFIHDTNSVYKCKLVIPNSDGTTLSEHYASINVHFREPTEEELDQGFQPIDSLTNMTSSLRSHASLPKSVSISDLIDIQLVQGERFNLVAPFNLRDAGEDIVIWWTQNDQFIAGRNTAMDDDNEYRCLLNKINQTIKLVKPAVEKKDTGFFTCWVSQHGQEKDATKCIEYSVDVLAPSTDSETDGASESPFEVEEGDEEEEQQSRKDEEKRLAKEAEAERKADEERVAEEAEAKRKDEEERIAVEAEAKHKAEEERAAEEAEAKRKDEEERIAVEAEAKHKAEEERVAEEAEAKRKAEEERIAVEVENKRKAEEERIAAEEAEAKRKAEEERIAKEIEAKRKAEEERVAEEAEAKRKAKEERIAEEIEAKRKAEEERVAEEAEAKRKAEEERIAEEVEAKRKAEEERAAEEAEAECKAEEERVAEEAEAKRKTEEERIAEEIEAKRKAEEERVAEETEAKRKAEEERIAEETEAKRKAEEERIAEEIEAKRKAEEERFAEETEAKRKAEEERITEEVEAKRKAEEERVAEEAEAKRKAEEERIAEEIEVNRKAEEERVAEEAEAKRKAEEERVAEEAEAKRKAEEERIAEEIEVNRKAEEEYVAEEAEAKRKAEEERAAEETEAMRKAEEERIAKEIEVNRKAEEERVAEEAEAKRKAEEERAAEETEAKRKAEEERIAEEVEAKRKAEDERVSEEAGVKQKAEEERAAEDAETERIDQEKRLVDEAESKRESEEVRLAKVAETQLEIGEMRPEEVAEETTKAEEKHRAEAAGEHDTAEKGKLANKDTVELRDEQEQIVEEVGEKYEAEKECSAEEATTEQKAGENQDTKDAEAKLKALEDTLKRETEAEKETEKDLYKSESEEEQRFEEKLSAKEVDNEAKQKAEDDQIVELNEVNETTEQERLAKEANDELKIEERRLAEESEAERKAEEQRLAHKMKVELDTEEERFSEEADMKKIAEKADTGARDEQLAKNAETKNQLADAAEFCRKSEESEEEKLAKEAEVNKKAEEEKLAKKKAEEEKLAKEDEAKKKAEEEKLAKEAEAKKKAEDEKLAKEVEAKKKAEEEKLAKEAEVNKKAEEEKLAKKKAEEEKLAKEDEAKKKAEEEKLAKEAEAKKKAEDEKLAKEVEAKKKAEEEKLAKEAEVNKKAEEEKLAKKKAEEEKLAKEAEAKKKAEEGKLAKEAEAKKKAEDEKLAKEVEAKKKAEEEKLAKEAEVNKKAEEEKLAKKKAEEEKLAKEAEAKKKAEEEKLAKEAEAKKEAEDEKLAKEVEAKKKAEEEKLAKEAEVKKKAEEEKLAKKKAKEEKLAKEAEAKKKADEDKLAKKAEAKKKAEEEKLVEEAEAKKKAEEEKLAKEAEAKKKAEEEKLAKEVEAKKKAEEEKLAKEAEAKKKAEEEKLAKKKANEDKLVKEAEAKKKAEDGKLAKEVDAKKKAEEEKLAKEAETEKKAEEEKLAKKKAKEEKLAKKKAKEAETEKKTDKLEAQQNAEDTEAEKISKEEQLEKDAGTKKQKPVQKEEEKQRREAEEEQLAKEVDAKQDAEVDHSVQDIETKRKGIKEEEKKRRKSDEKKSTKEAEGKSESSQLVDKSAAAVPDEIADKPCDEDAINEKKQRKAERKEKRKKDGALEGKRRKSKEEPTTSSVDEIRADVETGGDGQQRKTDMQIISTEGQKPESEETEPVEISLRDDNKPEKPEDDGGKKRRKDKKDRKIKKSDAPEDADKTAQTISFKEPDLTSEPSDKRELMAELKPLHEKLSEECEPLSIHLENQIPSLYEAMEQVTVSETLICIPSAEAMALSGQTSVHALEGHAFRLTILDLPQINLLSEWSFIDPTGQEHPIASIDETELETVVTSVTQSNGDSEISLDVASMSLAEEGTYRLKLFDTGETTEDGKFPILATINVPIQVAKTVVPPPEPASISTSNLHVTTDQFPFKMATELCSNFNAPIAEGSTVQLAAHVPTFGVSLGEADFEWRCNSLPLSSNEDFQVSCTSNDSRGTIKLTLPHVIQDQGGVYSVQLSKLGLQRIREAAADEMDVKSSEQLSNEMKFPKLTVQPMELQDSSVRVFEKKLPSSITARAGERVQLDVRVGSGHSVLRYEWLVDGKSILPEYTSDYAVSCMEKRAFCLTVPRIRPELSGTYELRVHLEDSDEIYSSKTQLTVDSGGRTKAAEYRLTSADGLMPLFTKRLQDHVNVDSGDNVRFSARVMAEPPAVVVWKHNGILLDGVSHRLKLSDDEVNPALNIRNVRPSDHGYYTCIATNALGRVECEAFLEVYGVDQYEPLDDMDRYSTTNQPQKKSALPPAVSYLRLTDTDSTNLSIRWKPLDPSTSPNVTYTVEMSKDNGKWWKPVLTDLTNCTVQIPADMASPLDSWQIRVLAANDYGLGSPNSTPIRVPVRACLPEMPAVKPRVEFEEAAAVLIQWSRAMVPTNLFTGIQQQPVDPNSVLGNVWYTVEVREGARSEWHRVASNLTTLSHMYHLRPGASTAIRIVACNRYGESSPTPIEIVHLDPNTLAPSLEYDPPWVAVSRGRWDGKGDSVDQQFGLVLHWKPAYMPEYCSCCVQGLEPKYRIEWRRGRSGTWQALADDVTDTEDGLRLPNELVSAVLDDAKRMTDARHVIALTNQAIELRVFCWNKFGESGPTKPYRLVASQLFRGEGYKNSVEALKQPMDTAGEEYGTELMRELDQIPVVALDERYASLKTHVNHLSPTEGIDLSWEKFEPHGMLNGTEDGPVEPTHNRYRIERLVKLDNELTGPRFVWKPQNTDTGLIYGENCVLDVTPGEVEQVFRLLVLNETNNCSVWVDAYTPIRIPPLTELKPSVPGDMTIKTVLLDGMSVSAEHHISWEPSSQPSLVTEVQERSTRTQGNSADSSLQQQQQLRYRVDARSILSDVSPWRRVSEVGGDVTNCVDRKAEPGLQLLYRVVPINMYGEGPARLSSVVTTPPLYTTLEGCIEDLRYMFLGPTELQLRWRLGDVAIDTLKTQSFPKSPHGKVTSDSENEFISRVQFAVETRVGYAGDWYPIVEKIRGDLTGKVCISDCVYLNRDVSFRLVALLDGRKTVPSRPIRVNIQRDSTVPDYSLVKPHCSVEDVQEYRIGWREPDCTELFASHILALTTPQVLQHRMSYTIEVQPEGQSEWDMLIGDLEGPPWVWARANPLKAYHIRVIPENQFGRGTPSRVVRIAPQVVIPDLSFMRPSIEAPADILAGSVAPELVWRLPKAYSLEKTLTPFTYEVQVRGVSRAHHLTLKPVPGGEQDTFSQMTQSKDDNDETVWRVLETNMKRSRLALGRLDPEQEYWLRIVAVTDYGRGAPSQPVRKMVDLAARRHQRVSASVTTMHEATPVSPTFTDPKAAVFYTPVGGRLELKSRIIPMHTDLDIRFDWLLNGKPIDMGPSDRTCLSAHHRSYVNKSGDTSVLQIDRIRESDFGVYQCKAVNIRGTAMKEFVVCKADSPVFLEVPVPVLTVKLHSTFQLPCWVDSVPAAQIYWTRDSKRVVESHRTKIGGSVVTETAPKANTEMTLDASLAVTRNIYQDGGLYTVVAENIAGRIQTSCLVHVEESPAPKKVTIRWTDIGKHYYVLRRLNSNSVNELRLLIDHNTGQEYVGKLFPLDDPIGRVSGAREFECLSRLCHTNVVQLVDAIVSDNTLILIMERFVGPNLLESILRCSTWSEYAAQAIIRQVTEAIGHLHSEGVVHFDLRPENLILARDLTIDTWDSDTLYTDLFKALSPLVTDTMGSGPTDRHKMSVLGSLLKLVGFTLAEPMQSDTRIDPSVNSCYPPQLFPRLEFVAPEVLSASDEVSGDRESYSSDSPSVGSAADMWSLGVLTYLLCTGSCPFTNPDTGEVNRAVILEADYSSRPEELSHLSEDCQQFIQDLLQRNPKARPSAEECLVHPWLSTPVREQTEFQLTQLSKYLERCPVPEVNKSHPKDMDTTETDSLGHHGLNRTVQQRMHLLTSGPIHREESMSSISSSKASSISNFSDILDLHELEADPPHSSGSSRHSIVSAEDASIEMNTKLSLLRQNTLTEAGVIHASTDESLEGGQLLTDAEDSHSSQTVDISENKDLLQPDTTKKAKILPPIPMAAPTFASPLRDASFGIHTGEARFSCQLAAFAHLPPGIHGHQRQIAQLYPSVEQRKNDRQTSATVAAWYLGGCLLSDGPGVQLGAGPGGWLWICLSNLTPEQSGSVVECVVRNRAGKARTAARLHRAEPPRCPGRPGVKEIRPTEALISWAPSEPASSASSGDIVYRIDAKFAINHHPPSWHTLGYSVDCRYLTIELKPETRYRIRLSAGNSHGWSAYSIASSEFRTPTTTSSETSVNVSSQLSDYDRAWMLTWRQSNDVYTLSDHPVAIQFTSSMENTIPLPVSDKALQRLHQHEGMIPDLDVLLEVCTPECLVERGQFSKLIVAKTNPMLTVQAEDGRDQLLLPPRMLLKVTKLDASGEDKKSLEDQTRREAIILTGLNTSCGGTLAAVDDYLLAADASYLFTANRRLLPYGCAMGWLANDAAKPMLGINVSSWIPGGPLIDVLCSRTEYNEFAIMRWVQQLLMALRWLQSKFFQRPHGRIDPRHILCARRSSNLPDIVLSGFGESSKTELVEGFQAPELLRGEPISLWSDLWSVGAFAYLLMTGMSTNTDVTPSGAHTSALGPLANQDSSQSISKDERSALPTVSSCVEFKRLKAFTKPAKKLVYNCLQQNPSKRGHIDFWLESRWFDLQSDIMNKMTKTTILASQLDSYRRRVLEPLQTCPTMDPSDLQLW